MEEHSSLPPSRYVDDTGTKKNDPMRQAFNGALGGRQNVKIMAHFVSQSRDSASNNLHRVWDEHMAAKDDPSRARIKTQHLPTSADSTGPVARLYQYMEEHSSLPPSRYADDTGTKKDDQRRQAFNAALGGRQNVQIMAHFVSQSRVSASNNLHRVWDEHMAAKNPNPKRKVGQPTLAEVFKKARKKKMD